MVEELERRLITTAPGNSKALFTFAVNHNNSLGKNYLVLPDEGGIRLLVGGIERPTQDSRKPWERILLTYLGECSRDGSIPFSRIEYEYVKGSGRFECFFGPENPTFIFPKEQSGIHLPLPDIIRGVLNSLILSGGKYQELAVTWGPREAAGLNVFRRILLSDLLKIGYQPVAASLDYRRKGLKGHYVRFLASPQMSTLELSGPKTHLDEAMIAWHKEVAEILGEKVAVS